MPADFDADQARRAEQERARFAVETDVHALPRIFHYWSHRYLRPKLEALGCAYPEDFFARGIAAAAGRRLAGPVRVLSIGAGNCDAELAVARLLRDRGVDGFHIECLEINAAMLERGRAAVTAAGFSRHFTFIEGDFNRWRADGPHDVVLANQSLHHVVELEHLFDEVGRALAPEGRFLVSDMIGRNGHQRWPEALAQVREFWHELPRSHRYNVQLRRQEDEFLDWDCSVEGFEGIRAQDVLPLLVERFGFATFLAWGNLIDPFIDRSFGPHFDPDRAWDREFIDRVHARDEAELAAGRITPTHLIATLTCDRDARPALRGRLTPETSIRRP
jgi:SAM-dependent methyltransferase